MNEIGQTLKQNVKILKTYPEWSMMYPKRYACPDDYTSAKIFASLATSEAIRARKFGGEDPNVNIYASVAKHAKLKCPTFWVEKDLCESLIKTTPPESFPLSEIKWPMESILFLLPLKEGAFCEWILITKINRGEVISLSSHHIDATTEHYEENVINCFGGCFYHGSGNLYQTCVPQSKCFGNAKDGIEFKTFDDSGCREMNHQEGDASDNILRLAINFLMFMSARPEDITGEIPAGKLKKNGKSKSHPHPPEEDRLWAPRFLGKEYGERYRKSLGGTHASPSAHWRRGHWRRQHYGPENQLIKDIWIEPVIVNA
jgi:hypothetical protein